WRTTSRITTGHYPEFAQKMDIFWEIVERIDSPWLGVNFDPSNTLLANEDPLALLERVKHRVVSMHASDRRPRPGIEIGPEGITDSTQLIHGEIGTGRGAPRRRVQPGFLNPINTGGCAPAYLAIPVF